MHKGKFVECILIKILILFERNVLLSDTQQICLKKGVFLQNISQKSEDMFQHAVLILITIMFFKNPIRMAGVAVNLLCKQEISNLWSFAQIGLSPKLVLIYASDP